MRLCRPKGNVMSCRPTFYLTYGVALPRPIFEISWKGCLVSCRIGGGELRKVAHLWHQRKRRRRARNRSNEALPVPLPLPLPPPLPLRGRRWRNIQALQLRPLGEVIGCGWSRGARRLEAIGFMLWCWLRMNCCHA